MIKKPGYIYKSSLSLIIFLSIIFSIQCTKSGSNSVSDNPCNSISIIITGTTTNSNLTTADGSISVSANGSSGILFSLNSGSFQSSGTFSNLSAGNYTITAKDSKGCSSSKSFTVNTIDPCTNQSFVLNTAIINSYPCSPYTGSISINITGNGSGFTYSIDGNTFQSNSTFSNLEPKNYTVSVKETGGCIKTTSVTVGTITEGILFSSVKNILTAKCAVSGCHSGAFPANGIDFTKLCEILNQKTRIKVRAVDFAGTTQQMPAPPNAALTPAEKDAITNWITAGGLYSN